jgi:hypothetical protein
MCTKERTHVTRSAHMYQGVHTCTTNATSQNTALATPIALKDLKVQTGLGVHPASYSTVTGVSSRGQSSRGAKLPPTSAEVKNKCSCNSTTYIPPWRGQGIPLRFYITRVRVPYTRQLRHICNTRSPPNCYNP